ncbi:MAG TPA: TadE/TadG family type IV pilus assembly protein [Bryobacteraceae bacterium]|jgi:Flp pilus assembly protein TadG
MQDSHPRAKRRLFGSERGTAAVEVALLLPWIVVSFMAVLDFGFSAYALIATQNAARVAATWGSASNANAIALTASPSPACGTYALPLFKYAPTPVTACGASLSATPGSYSKFSITYVTVAVAYTVNLLAIPGIMPGSITINKTVTMPVRQ